MSALTREEAAKFLRTVIHRCDPACACRDPDGSPTPVITNEEAVAAQRYDQELIALAADQSYRAAGDLYRECARADRLESENDRLSSYERRTRNPHNDWVPE